MSTERERPRRILMTADTYGGTWTYSLEIAAALAAHARRRGLPDPEVHLATMGRRMSGAKRDEVEATPGVVAVHESEFALEWMPDPWVDVLRAGHWLLGLAGEVSPDVVHVNGYSHGALEWPAPCVVVAHSCVLSWWWAVRGEQAPAEWTRYQDQVRKGLNAADEVVAPSRFMLGEISRWYGYVGGRVIWNCRRSDWVRPVPKEPLLLAAGRLWDEGKDLGGLARVVPRLAWPVCIAGDAVTPGAGTAGGAGESSAAPVSGSAGVTGGASTSGAAGLLTRAGAACWLGELPFRELAVWLSRASAFVSTARYEPFGLGVLEAALAGCALVLSDLPTFRELWDGAAVFVDPQDDDLLAAELGRLAEDHAHVGELSSAARERALAFGPAQAGAAYFHLYDEVASLRGAAVRGGASADAQAASAPSGWGAAV